MKALSNGIKLHDDGWFTYNYVHIPKESMKAAIEPIEGKACFCFSGYFNDVDSPEYLLNFYNGGYDIYVRASELTIGLTCGEIRELLEWCDE